MNWISIVNVICKLLGLDEYEPKVKNYIVILLFIIVFNTTLGYFTLDYFRTQYTLCEVEKNRIRFDYEKKVDTLILQKERLNDLYINEIRTNNDKVLDLMKEVNKIKQKIK